MGMRRNNDRTPVLTRADDRLAQTDRARVVKIRERFVQEKHRDPLGFHARQGGPSALSRRESLDRAIHVFADAPSAKRPVDPPRVAAAETHEELEVLAGGEPAQEHRAVADVQDLARSPALAAGEGHEARERAKQGRFPRTVRPADQREAGADRKVHRAKDHAIV
jgi:hypothetical protein